MCNKHESDWETTSCSFSCKGVLSTGSERSPQQGAGAVAQHSVEAPKKDSPASPEGSSASIMNFCMLAMNVRLRGARHTALRLWTWEGRRVRALSGVRWQQHMSRGAVAAGAATELAGHEGQLR